MPFLDYIKGVDIYHPGNFVFMLPNIMVINGDEERKDGMRGDVQRKDEVRSDALSRQIENRYSNVIEKRLPLLAAVILLILALVTVNFFYPFSPVPSSDGNINQIQTGTSYPPSETSPDRRPDMPANLVNSYSKINSLVEKREL